MQVQILAARGKIGVDIRRGMAVSTVAARACSTWKFFTAWRILPLALQSCRDALEGDGLAPRRGYCPRPQGFRRLLVGTRRTRSRSRSLVLGGLRFAAYGKWQEVHIGPESENVVTHESGLPQSTYPKNEMSESFLGPPGKVGMGAKPPGVRCCRHCLTDCAFWAGQPNMNGHPYLEGLFAVKAGSQSEKLD